MQLFVVFLLLTSIRAQQDSCSCSCCVGQSCNPTSLPVVYVQSCSLVSCLAKCMATYSQCQSNYPNGVLSAQCGSNITPQYHCRCDCCNTGSPSCVPSYVGNSLAYSCQTGACSIACNGQFPQQCVAGQNGLTQGTCTGVQTTTATTTTTTGPWLGNTCSCTCCLAGSNCPPTSVGAASASDCSSTSCTQACRNRYPSSCLSSSNISQTSGTCMSDTGENTACGCRCCSTNGCINYRINTKGDCATCNSMCRQYTPCSTVDQVTVQTCSTNNAKASLPWMSFIFIIIISTFFIIN